MNGSGATMGFASDAGEAAMAGESLAGKRVLFFAVRYFGYEQRIMDELRRRGAEVDYLPDRPFNTPLMTAVTRYSRPAPLTVRTMSPLDSAG